jgi:hypothetical protein
MEMVPRSAKQGKDYILSPFSPLFALASLWGCGVGQSHSSLDWNGSTVGVYFPFVNSNTSSKTIIRFSPQLQGSRRHAIFRTEKYKTLSGATNCEFDMTWQLCTHTIRSVMQDFDRGQVLYLARGIEFMSPGHRMEVRKEITACVKHTLDVRKSACSNSNRARLPLCVVRVISISISFRSICDGAGNPFGVTAAVSVPDRAIKKSMIT